MVCILNIITIPNWSRGVEQCSFITALFPIIPNDMIHACSISSNKQINVNSIILTGLKIECRLRFIVLFCFCFIRKSSWSDKLVPIWRGITSILILKMCFEVPFKTNKNGSVTWCSVPDISDLDSVFDVHFKMLNCSYRYLYATA